MVEGITWDQLLEEAGDEVASGFDPLPADVYEVEVVEANHTMTKTTPSKNMWRVQYKVIAPGTQWNNRRLFNNIVLSPDNKKALGFFFRHMAAHGLNQQFFATKPQADVVASTLRGRRVRAKVVQKPYKGETQNEIDGYLPSQSGSATAPPAAVATPPAGAPPPPAPVAPAAPAPAPVAAAPAPPAPAPAPAAPVQQDPWAAAPAPAPAPAAPAPVEPSPQAGTVPPPPPLEGLPF